MKHLPKHVKAITRRSGFTLIELSIVLVVIGLIVGGVLVGQDLINAAAIRAQITQIEKYNTAVNAFRGKYNNQLPGDISDPDATNFGFTPRGTVVGTGDGDGLLKGNEDPGDPVASAIPCGGYSAVCGGNVVYPGEPSVFWVDLTTANFLDGSFTNAQPMGGSDYYITTSSSPVNINTIAPLAKIGNGNYVYVMSSYGTNYFSVSQVHYFNGGAFGEPTTEVLPGLSVLQAYGIDKKLDDGYPQSGSVTAQYLLNSYPSDAALGWVVPPFGSSQNPTGNQIAPTTVATSPSSLTCYDNGGTTNAVQQYSMGTLTGNGNNINCALSFKFQ